MKRLSLTVTLITLVAITTSSLASPSDTPALTPAPPTCEAASDRTPPPQSTPESSPMANTAVFEGCWTPTAAGTCRAVYQVGTGYRLCGACSADGTPPKFNGSCTSISLRTLNLGYWCS